MSDNPARSFRATRLARRQVLAAAALMEFMAPQAALAQDYPSRPVEIVVGSSPGRQAELQTFLVDEIDKWAVLIEAAGVERR